MSGCSSILSTIESIENSSNQANVKEIVDQVYDIIPAFDTKYLFKQLNETDLAFVIKAYRGIMNFEDTIEMNIQFEDENRPFQLLQMIQYECPEIYQFTTNSSDSTVTIDWIERNKQIVNLHVSYLMTQEEYEASYSIIAQEIQDIVNQANQYTNDIDKELFVYNYIANQTIYNENALHNSSCYGVLIDHEAACLGISRTFQWILNELNIPCLTVGGYTANKETGHAWNIVKLDDANYSVDLTSDTIQIDKDNYNLYLYFNVTDEELRDKYELTQGLPDIPKANGTYYNYYSYYNLQVYDYMQAYDLIQQNIYQLFNQGYGSFNVKILDAQAYFDIVNNISQIYNECRQNYSYPSFQASYANSDAYQILHFEIK